MSQLENGPHLSKDDIDTKLASLRAANPESSEPSFRSSSESAELDDSLATPVLEQPAVPSETSDPEEVIATPNRRRRKGIAAFIAATVLGGVIAGGSVLASGSDNDPSKARPDRENSAAPSNPTPTESAPANTDTTPVVEASETPTQNAETRESNIYDSTTLSAEEIATSEKLDQMDIDTFEKQSLKDRLIYILYKNHETQERILFSDHTDQVFTDNDTTLAQHSPVFLALNAKSGATDIMRANIYSDQLSNAWKVDEDEYGSGVADSLTATKLLSGSVLDLESPEYRSYRQDAMNDTETGRYTDVDVNDFKIVGEKEAVPVTNPIDGSQTVEKTVTIFRAGVNTEVTYIFIPLVEQLGGEEHVDGNGLWLLKRSSEYDTERLTQ